MSKSTKLINRIERKYNQLSVDACRWVVNNFSFVCALTLVALVFVEADTARAGGNTPLEACKQLLSYIEGGFASLVAAAAGLGAIIAAAVGGFKAAWGLLVVSVGAFILRSYIGVFLAACN